MRPVRITGVTGTSPIVALDTYSPAQASVILTGGGALEFTLDDPFQSSPAPVFAALTILDGIIPPGVRAVRATGMAPADVLTVSQQGIA